MTLEDLLWQLRQQMIESISLSNFRLHKHLEIFFDKNLTCIVGRSYSGKSTVLRALRWVCLNKPAGTSMIRWGAKQAKVTLKVDGNIITRIRGKGKNLYLLTTAEGEKHKYASFGNDVPDRISKILNLSEVNFQNQHSLPFWFGESSGIVAKKLNKIVNLEIIDRTLSNLTSTRNKAKSSLEISKERFLNIQQRKRELSFVGEMKEEWKNVQRLQKEMVDAEYAVVTLESCLSTCLEYQEIAKQTRPPSYDFVIENWRRYSDLNDECALLNLAIENAKDRRKRANNLKSEADKWNKELKKAQKGKCPLCGRNV